MCFVLKLQYIYLAIVAALKRVTHEDWVPEVAQCGPCYLPFYVFTASKESSVYILFIKKQHKQELFTSDAEPEIAPIDFHFQPTVVNQRVR